MPGSAEVTVTDSANNTAHAAITITALQPLAITPSLVTIRETETALFVASGGSGGYTYSVYSGAGSIDDPATGVYTAPAAPGTAVVRVTDGSGGTSDATVTIVPGGPLEISPANAIVPVRGIQTFSAQGGAPPYTFSVSSGPGSVNSVTGIYSAPGATGVAIVQVADSNNDTDTAMVTVAGSGCGLTHVEVESNDDIASADVTGITLVPGCSVTIEGTTDGANGAWDYYRIEPSETAYISIIVEWASGDLLDLTYYRHNGTVLATAVGEDGSATLLTPFGQATQPKYIGVQTKNASTADYTIIVTGS
jgi:hypothetical protein